MVSIESIEEGNYLEMIVKGEVDASSSIHLDEALGKCVESHQNIIINLEGLEYISSAGLGVFMSYIEDINTKGIKMSLFGLNESVKHIFEILGIDQLLDIVNNKSMAIEKVDEASA